MTPYQRRLNPSIQRMAEDMQLRNLAQSTIDSYTYHVDKFCRHFGKPADQLGPVTRRGCGFAKRRIRESRTSMGLGNRFASRRAKGARNGSYRHRRGCSTNSASIGRSTGQAIISSLARRPTGHCHGDR